MINAKYVQDRLINDKENFILECEKKYENQIDDVVNLIMENTENIVLLAGPSSSGKTTTSKKIAYRLLGKNISTNVVSLDDFYLNREEVPSFKNGDKDLETIKALDIDRLKKNLKDLYTNGVSEFPIFDFLTKGRSEETNEIKHDKNHVLIIEGIHALNPIITGIATESGGLINFMKLYISVENGYEIDGKEILSNNRVRFIRRLVRDYKHRNSEITQTFSMWSSVRNGEEKYIVPFKDSADYQIGSNFEYEPGLFKKYIKNLLDLSDTNDRNYSKLLSYYNIYDDFDIILQKNIPKNSLMQEFLW